MRTKNGLAPRSMQAPIRIVLIVVLLLSCTVILSAQKRPQGKVPAAKGLVRVWIPAGNVGGIYWIYLDGRLQSIPASTQDVAGFNVVFVPEGGWQAFGDNGAVVASARWDVWIKPYLASGDKYRIFRTVELPVAAGTHNVELMVPTTGKSSSLAPLPFAITAKYAAHVISGRAVDIYPAIPADWTTSIQASPAAWASPCQSSGFRLSEMQESYLSWGQRYQSNPIVKLLHAVRGSVSPDSVTVEIDLEGGTREFARDQMERIVNKISLNAQDRFNHDHAEIAYCKSRQPQFAKAFDEYDKTITLIEEDLASLKRMIAAMR